LFSRKVLACEIATNNTTELIINTFINAFELRGKPDGLLFHSDQGTQYTSYKFRTFLRELGVKQSFSYPGMPYTLSIMINHKSCICASLAQPCARLVSAASQTLAKQHDFCTNFAFMTSHSGNRITTML
ncbi:MAG: DDE-type integrase/transposase/recombinase, partial [Victivallaceae bacterium]